ncbi:hypothetical protein KCU81_g76, partial [Aureobasidium melanogenum]
MASIQSSTSITMHPYFWTTRGWTCVNLEGLLISEDVDLDTRERTRHSSDSKYRNQRIHCHNHRQDREKSDGTVRNENAVDCDTLARMISIGCLTWELSMMGVFLVVATATIFKCHWLSQSVCNVADDLAREAISTIGVND